MRRFIIKVTFNDDDYLQTAFNAENEQEIRNHYIGKAFVYEWYDDGGWHEDVHVATSVEIL